MARYHCSDIRKRSPNGQATPAARFQVLRSASASAPGSRTSARKKHRNRPDSLSVKHCPQARKSSERRELQHRSSCMLMEQGVYQRTPLLFASVQAPAAPKPCCSRETTELNESLDTGLKKIRADPRSMRIDRRKDLPGRRHILPAAIR